MSWPWSLYRQKYFCHIVIILHCRIYACVLFTTKWWFCQGAPTSSYSEATWSRYFVPDDFTFTVLTRRYKCWSQFSKDWTTSCKITLMSQGNRRDVGHNSNLHSTAQTDHREYFQVTYWHTFTIFKLWPSQPEKNTWKMFNNITGIWSNLQIIFCNR